MITGTSAAMEFTALAVSRLPDLSQFGGQTNGQFFPRYTFQPKDEQPALDNDDPDSSFRRVDNITDAILADYRSTYGTDVEKNVIFYYVYALLHCPAYRTEYASDLKKMLPRIPKVRDFRGFADAGRRLADLHVGYETVQPYPLTETVTAPIDTSESEVFRVEKMRFGGPGRAKDRGTIVYNAHVTLSGIPEEAYRYMLGSRPAVEWIIDRYRVTTDKASGIVNDPNDWCAEHGDPHYIVDLLRRIVTVSVETMKIVDALPELAILAPSTKG